MNPPYPIMPKGKIVGTLLPHRPDVIDEHLDMVFVFGSNLGGFHGAGAAKFAMDTRNFPYGLGVGPASDCYAIPTKDQRINPLSLPIINLYVDQFIAFAALMHGSDTQFKVTRIGCGLAGFEDKNIAPMFIGAPQNCHFDEKWMPWVGPAYKFWGTF